MTRMIELFRIDERLLHGQVVVGWGQRLGLTYYAVADDELAGSEWEQDLYAGGLPETAQAEFLTVSDAADGFRRLEERRGRGALLTRTTAAMRELAERGLLAGRAVNVGCLGAAPGRTRVLDYVHLSLTEATDLRAIAERSGPVSARDLPSSPEVGLEELLGGVDA